MFMESLKKSANNKIVISIVSHGHGKMVNELLNDISKLNLEDHIIFLTENIPEDIKYIKLNSLQIIKNKSPKGFGENHNYVFKKSKSKFFLILNPDVRIKIFQLNELIKILNKKNIAVCAPRIIDKMGNIENSARKFPTLFSIIKKIILPIDQKIDYKKFDNPFHVEWISGAFMLFKSDSYKNANGFDEKYFMYYEDVDICKRLSILGYKIYYEPNQYIIHNAQKMSHKKLKYFVWHIKSLIRYLSSKY